MRFLGLALLVTGCGPGDAISPPTAVITVDAAAIADLRILFGHQSVGRDILAGIRTVAPDLTIKTIDAAPERGGVLLETSIGQNQHPKTKDRAFLETLAGLETIDLALYKYCYVDIGPDTDPLELFENYAGTLAQAPVRTVPVTLPLTTMEAGWKRWFKQLAGRPTQAALNAKRMVFNESIREEYGEGNIVDLARIESTREDGSRCLAEVDGRPVEYLAAEFTEDGAHLNTRGRVHVASGFVRSLAELATR